MSTAVATTHQPRKFSTGSSKWKRRMSLAIVEDEEQFGLSMTVKFPPH